MQNYEVIVFCGGKCGGTTLSRTFQNNNNFNFLHMHSLTCNGIFNDLLGVKIKDYEIINIINETSKNKKIYIIDSYRNPIERIISAFFENLHDNNIDFRNESINQLIEMININLNKNIKEQLYNSLDQLLRYYNLPLFEKFDFDKGYNIIEKDNKVFIKILFKDICKWDSILSEIFKQKIILYPDNLSENKEHYLFYKFFCQEYKVPKWFVDDYLINNKDFHIYNTLEDKYNYILKWSGNNLKTQNMLTAIPLPTPEPIKEPTPEPIKEPTPEPIKVPTPEPIPEQTPLPIKEQIKEPIKEPTPEPIKEPTPEPIKVPTPEPIPEQTPLPIKEQTPEPTPVLTPEPIKEPIKEPTPEPIKEPIPEPIKKQTKKQIKNQMKKPKQLENSIHKSIEKPLIKELIIKNIYNVNKEELDVKYDKLVKENEDDEDEENEEDEEDNENEMFNDDEY